MDLSQHGTEPLVGHDVALGDTALLVEGVEGKTASAVAEFDATIGVRVDSTPLAAQLECLGAGSIR